MFDRNKVQELRKYEIIGALTHRWANMMLEASFEGELNDAVMRKRVSGALWDLMNEFGMERYFENSHVLCDESNNPPAWIDAREPCKVTVHIQWSKSPEDLTVIELPNRR